MRQKVKLRIYHRCIKCVHFGTCVKFPRRCSSFETLPFGVSFSIYPFDL